jgi:ABC-2 type transport system permease protein
MLLAGIRKDIALLLRDRGALISMFALPLIFIGVFGSMLKFGPETGKPQNIGIFVESGDTRGAAMRASVVATPGFVVVDMTSADAARTAVANESVAASLIIPRDFSPADGRSVELSIDGAAPIQSRAPLQGALTGAVISALVPVAPEVAKLLINPVIAKTPPQLAKPQENISGFQVSVPGNAVLFAFFIALTVALSFSEEKRSGTWRRQLASPVSRFSILFAKLVPYYIVSLIQMAFLFGVGAAVFGMKVSGSLPAFVVLVAAVSLAAVTLGLVFASFGGSEKQLGSIGSVTTLVMGLLGGCMIPRLIMPGFFRTVGNFVPQSWALDGYYSLLIRTGTGFADIAPQLGMLMGFAALFCVVGVARFRFEQ